MELDIDSGGVRLHCHLARPPAATVNKALVVCHGMPTSEHASAAGATYPQLADRLSAETGWPVLALSFRGTGQSGGHFSLGGWLADMHAAIDATLALDGVSAVWLAGFGSGGALALCAAGEDERVRGVAAFSAPADFEPWAADARRFLDSCRRVGVISDRAFPPSVEAWTRELREIRPLALVGKIPPRSIMLVHGSDDDEVDLVDARALADAAEGQVELRVLAGAGHRLRHDPRAVAILVGWLERQVL